MPAGLCGGLQPRPAALGGAACHANSPLLLFQSAGRAPAVCHWGCGPGSQPSCGGSVSM